MALLDLLLAQLADPFRIGLLAALVVTTLQTSAHTGRAIPLVLGVVFVAVLIATTTGAGEAGYGLAIGVGIVANALVVAVILGLVVMWRRLFPRNSPPA